MPERRVSTRCRDSPTLQTTRCCAFALTRPSPAGKVDCLAQSTHGAPDRPFRTPEPSPEQGPPISEQWGANMAEKTRREQDPRSYAGQANRPGRPGGQERTTMARAGAAPVPVMANTDKGAAPTAKGSAGKAGSAAKGSAGKAGSAAKGSAGKAGSAATAGSAGKAASAGK